MDWTAGHSGAVRCRSKRLITQHKETPAPPLVGKPVSPSLIRTCDSLTSDASARIAEALMPLNVVTARYHNAIFLNDAYDDRQGHGHDCHELSFFPRQT